MNCDCQSEKQVLISVIIPTFKRNEELIVCLQSLQHYFIDGNSVGLYSSVEVVVSDDAADKELQAFIGVTYPWCRYTIGPGRGPSANRNHGAYVAKGEWIVFTDDDCLPQPGWLEAYASIGGKYEVMEGRTSAEGIRSRVDEECPTNETGGYLWSCNLAIKKDIFMRLGGFNEDFPAAAMEDVDLRKRIEKEGIDWIFVQDAVVKHPWRQRKDVRFVKKKAQSVASFIMLHPEMAKQYTLRALVYKLLVSLKSSLLYCLNQNNIRGLARQTYLETYLAASIWKEVRGIRSSNSSR
jgi:GT2 family glycosyltransferase